MLAARNFGESDRILDIYTAELGRLCVIAKGANHSRKRFVNKLEPFTQLVAQLRPGREGRAWFLFMGADLVSGPPGPAAGGAPLRRCRHDGRVSPALHH